MALEGHGIAFLPYSAVKKELRSRRLVSAVGALKDNLEMTMDVRAYRAKPLADAQGKPVKSSAGALWNYLAGGRLTK